MADRHFPSCWKSTGYYLRVPEDFVAKVGTQVPHLAER